MHNSQQIIALLVGVVYITFNKYNQLISYSFKMFLRCFLTTYAGEHICWYGECNKVSYIFVHVVALFQRGALIFD